ncbi:hypothetical protein HK104_010723 [Borealophlyctis nickersoniae]|nr:hypothetical protein HK104_010723 [Borealophlyctis nickersoniae]
MLDAISKAAEPTSVSRSERPSRRMSSSIKSGGQTRKRSHGNTDTDGKERGTEEKGDGRKSKRRSPLLKPGSVPARKKAKIAHLKVDPHPFVKDEIAHLKVDPPPFVEDEKRASDAYTTNHDDANEFVEPLPERDAKTGKLVFEGFPEFQPNLTPEQVLRMGAFGGTYYRPIHSSIIKADIENDWQTDLPTSWVKDLDVARMITSPMYRADVNRFGKKCGLTLEEWEGKGWITQFDPRGWFQWYVRFYRGRRCEDDKRQVFTSLVHWTCALDVDAKAWRTFPLQIGRWQKCADQHSGRWLRVYLGKCLRANLPSVTLHDPKDETVSPVIRQVLMHWGVEVDDGMYTQFKEEKGV